MSPLLPFFRLRAVAMLGLVFLIGIVSWAVRAADSFEMKTLSAVEAGREVHFQSIDRVLASDGPSFVAKTFLRGTPSEISVLIRWIVDRGYAQFYGHVVEAAQHSLPAIKSSAIVRLLMLDPIDLRTHENRIQQIHAAELDAQYRSVLQLVVDKMTTG